MSEQKGKAVNPVDEAIRAMAEGERQAVMRAMGARARRAARRAVPAHSARPADKVLARGLRAEHAGVLFMFKAGDGRLDGVWYEPLGGLRPTNRTEAAGNGLLAKVYVGDDGAEYLVFSDWSARRRGE